MAEQETAGEGAKPDADVVVNVVAEHRQIIGGIPVDRADARRIVDEVVERVHAGEVFGLVVTPDGTRGGNTHCRDLEDPTQLRDRIDNRVLDVARLLRVCVAARRGEQSAFCVDDASCDLRPTNVNPDGVHAYPFRRCA